jgi:hypothetical protein
MSLLREAVMIKTEGGELQGELFVGADGLPELRTSTAFQLSYRPETFPNAWSLHPISRYGPEVLLESWRQITCIRERLRVAQRDADAEERRDPDCIDEYKRDTEMRGER